MNQKNNITNICSDNLYLILQSVNDDRVMRQVCSQWMSLIEYRNEVLFNRILNNCGESDRKTIEIHASGQKTFFGRISTLRMIWPMKKFGVKNSGDWVGLFETLPKKNPEELRNFIQTIKDNHGKIKKVHIAFKNSLKESLKYQNPLDTILLAANALRSIKELDLRNSQLKELPSSIKYVSNLITLNVYDNYLKTLPEEIGELKQLKKLNAAYNCIKTLPAALAQLAALQELNLLANDSLKDYPSPLDEMKNREGLKILVHQSA